MAIPVVEERHVVHDSDSSGAAMIAVLLVAAVLIIGFLLFMMQAFPFANGGAGGASDINVDLPNVTTPDVTPDVDVDNTVNTNPAP